MRQVERTLVEVASTQLSDALVDCDVDLFQAAEGARANLVSALGMPNETLRERCDQLLADARSQQHSLNALARKDLMEAQQHLSDAAAALRRAGL